MKRCTAFAALRLGLVLAAVSGLLFACGRPARTVIAPAPAAASTAVARPAPFSLSAKFVPKTKTADVNGVTVEHDDYAGRNGRAEAEADIGRDDVRILVYGLPDPNLRAYAKLLRDEAGVRVEIIAGCVVSDPLREFARRYNEVSLRQIEARFGAGYLGRVEERACNTSQAKSGE